MSRTLKIINEFAKNVLHDTKENKKENFSELTQLFNFCRETKYGDEDNTQSDCS